MSMATGASRATLGPLYAVIHERAHTLHPNAPLLSAWVWSMCVTAATPTSELGSRGTNYYAHIHLLADGQLYSTASSCPAPHHKGASPLLRQSLLPGRPA